MRKNFESFSFQFEKKTAFGDSADDSRSFGKPGTYIFVAENRADVDRLFSEYHGAQVAPGGFGIRETYAFSEQSLGQDDISVSAAREFAMIQRDLGTVEIDGVFIVIFGGYIDSIRVFAHEGEKHRVVTIAQPRVADMMEAAMKVLPAIQSAF